MVAAEAEGCMSVIIATHFEANTFPGRLATMTIQNRPGIRVVYHYRHAVSNWSPPLALLHSTVSVTLDSIT